MTNLTNEASPTGNAGPRATNGAAGHRARSAGLSTATRKRRAATAGAARRRSAQAAAAASPKSRPAARRATAMAVDTLSAISAKGVGLLSDVTELIGEASRNTLSFNPLIGLSRRNVATAARSLLKAVTKTPRRAGVHYAGYLKELAHIARGQSALAPDPKDRRFADPAWKTNPLYARLLQAYVATQKELGAYIEQSELGTIEKGRAQFFASLVTDALAPSNWLLGNPAAVRKILDTGGGHLVQGFKNLVHDLRHNHMMPTMVDTQPFKVGETIATSAGQVVLRHEMFELLQYTPTTAQVHARPLVIAPPQVNKFYAMDLTPDKSLVKWATDSGVQLFMVSWRNPGAEHRLWGVADYVHALDAAVDAARQITGSPDVNMWGSCSGGMTLAAYLGWLAAKGQRKVANTTLAVCVLDAKAALADSTMGLFASPATLRAARARSRRKGFVGGEEMASMFAWLRPNDLIWNYWVNNYLLGNAPPAYDVLAWNADTTRLPGQLHCDLLDIVEKNPFVNPGALEIDGLPIDLTQVDVGGYVISGITDHITPWRACYGTARLFGPDTQFVLANAGHLQSLINPPGAPKSFYFTAPATQDDPMAWAEAAQPLRQEGSWWPHWRSWIQQRSGELQPAPKRLGSRKHKPVCAAPGTYVHER